MYSLIIIKRYRNPKDGSSLVLVTPPSGYEYQTRMDPTGNIAEDTKRGQTKHNIENRSNTDPFNKTWINSVAREV